MRYRLLFLTLSMALLSGCGSFPKFGGFKSAPKASVGGAFETEVVTPELMAPPPPRGAITAEALDTTTEAQKAAALASPAPQEDAALGTVSVALGNVTEPGFWLRSGLVKEVTPGQVKTKDGASVQLDLLPGNGAPQMSLAAFRALNLGLTDLPEVMVYRY